MHGPGTMEKTLRSFTCGPDLLLRLLVLQHLMGDGATESTVMAQGPSSGGRAGVGLEPRTLPPPGLLTPSPFLRLALYGRVWRRKGSAESHQLPLLGKPPDWKEGKGQQLCS